MSNVIIITAQKNKNGNYEFTEEKLRDIIQDAYDKGYRQGLLNTPISINPTLYGEFNPGKAPSDLTPKPWWGEVTCQPLNCENKASIVNVAVGEQIPIPGLEDF